MTRERKIYIGGSRSRKWKPFSALIIFYQKFFFGFDADLSHTYTKYVDELTGQWMIAESSHGEHHKMTVENWLIQNDIVEEYCINCTENQYIKIMTNINSRLQTSYSEMNIIGVPLYDLYEATRSKIMKCLAMLFDDGKGGVICSESTAYNLEVLGVNFKRPADFVKPHLVIEKLRLLVKSEDYIERSI